MKKPSPIKEENPIGLEAEKDDCLTLENISLRMDNLRMQVGQQLGVLAGQAGELRDKMFKKANLSQDDWQIDLQKRRFVKKHRPQAV